MTKNEYEKIKKAVYYIHDPDEIFGSDNYDLGMEILQDLVIGYKRRSKLRNGQTEKRILG